MSGVYSVSLDQIEWVRKNCGPELWDAVDLLTARSGWDILLALDTVIRERDTLLDRLNSEIPPHGYEISEYAAPNEAADALRSGEAGKGAIYCGEHTAAEIPTILAAHPGYTLPSSHDF